MVRRSSAYSGEDDVGAAFFFGIHETELGIGEIFFSRVAEVFHFLAAQRAQCFVGNRIEVADDNMRRETKRERMSRAAVATDNEGFCIDIFSDTRNISEVAIAKNYSLPELFIHALVSMAYILFRELKRVSAAP